jgi:RNA-splicing ligase RtcB
MEDSEIRRLAEIQAELNELRYLFREAKCRLNRAQANHSKIDSQIRALISEETMIRQGQLELLRSG